MKQYKYNALNNQGHIVKGAIPAVNESDLETKLTSIGLSLIDYVEIKSNKVLSSGKVTSQDVIILCIQLEQLEKAGVPLLDALGDLRDGADNQTLKDALTNIYDEVSNGKLLSQAIASYPNIFDEIFVSLIAAGEKTGRLDTIFHQMSEHLKWIDDLKSKIKKASYYPGFLLVVMIGIIALMMNFVVPQLSKFLLSQGFELPIHTKALISTSSFFQEYGMSFLMVPIIIIPSILFSRKHFLNFRYNTDNILLNMPKAGMTLRKIEIARFCRFFALTYRSGLGILECLEISTNTISNLVLKESLEGIKVGVSEGKKLTEALVLTNQFPSMVTRMVKVGEDSGKLDTCFDTVNFFYDREVKESVESLISSIQPTLTMILGVMMLWVTSAVFGPLYTSLSKMNF